MNTKMLKYIIACCIITLCNAAPSASPSQVGTYNELLLVQSLSRNHGWVISGLMSVDRYSNLLTNCVDFRGLPLIYNDAQLSIVVRRELEEKWPVITSGQTEIRLWESAYNTYGSCIEDDASNYFGLASQLFYNYPVVDILENAGIASGTSYEYEYLAQAIADTLEHAVYLKCVQNEETGQQELSAITQCFETSQYVVGCSSQEPDGTDIHQCRTNDEVYYPEFTAPSEADMMRRFLAHHNLSG